MIRGKNVVLVLLWLVILLEQLHFLIILCLSVFATKIYGNFNYKPLVFYMFKGMLCMYCIDITVQNLHELYIL